MNTNNKSFFQKYWIWLLGGLVIVLIGLAIWKSKSKPKGIAVTTDKVVRRNISEKVTASGKIFPEKEIKISSDVSGEVVELYIKEGDSVKVGQILARVNPDAYQSALERGSAGVKAAQSTAGATQTNIQSSIAQMNQIRVQLETARKNLERSKTMLNDGIISKAEYESSETNVKNLESSLASAEAAVEASKKQSKASQYHVEDAQAMLKEFKTNLDRTIIKAPANGIISKLNIEKGERVVGTMQMSGTEIMRIADLNAMEVQLEVSENDIVRVSVGDEARIDVDAYPDKRFMGRVTEIANSASNVGLGALGGISNDQVTKFLVKVRIDKESYSDMMKENGTIPFRPGMSATVEIKTNQQDNVLSIPIQAVMAYDAKAEENKRLEKLKGEKDKALQKEEKVSLSQNDFHEAVFVKINDTVSRVDVITGIQDENYIEINKGLEENMEIVVGPYSAVSKDLKSGSRVYIKKEKEKDKEEKRKDND